jgi:hypothetical protein
VLHLPDPEWDRITALEQQLQDLADRLRAIEERSRADAAQPSAQELRQP